MDFSMALERVQEVLKSIGSDISKQTYDGIIVKELKASNTLDENRNTHQSHIAITGPQMDMFPYIRAEGYFNCEYNKKDENLKQYFVAQIPVYIHKENIQYLNINADFAKNEQDLVYVSIVRSRRDAAVDQIQMSMKKIDSPEYVKYRKIVHSGDYMIILKRKKQLVYDLYTVKSDDEGNKLQELNNHFYKLTESNLSTPVKINEIIETKDDDRGKSSIYFSFKTGFKSSFSRNRILFGAPGTGKSYTLNQDVKQLVKDGGRYERVTFHPDYSYANFVGTYKPVPFKRDDGMDGITYKYVPGPFSRILVDALKNAMSSEPAKPYVLIVEEINRANMAAVFGDVFQLLDRNADNISEYPIHASEDMKKYLAEKLGGKEDDYNEVRIPDNMFIWATMNSADQGVFPMDTAFKRRWDFTYFGINTNEKEIADINVVLGTGDYARSVSWNKLRKAINDKLLEVHINEDKLMGPFFISMNVLQTISEDNGEQFRQVFKDKVLMYLFEDVVRRDPSLLFGGCTNSRLYSEIVKEFDEKGVAIFHSSIRSQFVNQQNGNDGVVER